MNSVGNHDARNVEMTECRGLETMHKQAKVLFISCSPRHRKMREDNMHIMRSNVPLGVDIFTSSLAEEAQAQNTQSLLRAHNTAVLVPNTGGMSLNFQGS